LESNMEKMDRNESRNTPKLGVKYAGFNMDKILITEVDVKNAFQTERNKEKSPRKEIIKEPYNVPVTVPS